jgi:hypothetical protein
MARCGPLAFALSLVIAAALSAPGAQAISTDEKAVSPSLCQPYAPDTTAAEIQVTQTGIYNPGTSTEKVVCAMPRDLDTYYNEGATATVVVYYRVLGAAPGRVTCTYFVGSSSMHTQAVSTVSASGDLVSGGLRSAVQLTAPAQNSTFRLVPSTMICALSPKASMGAIYIMEYGATDSVEAPV